MAEQLLRYFKRFLPDESAERLARKNVERLQRGFGQILKRDDADEVVRSLAHLYRTDAEGTRLVDLIKDITGGRRDVALSTEDLESIGTIMNQAQNVRPGGISEYIKRHRREQDEARYYPAGATTDDIGR